MNKITFSFLSLGLIISSIVPSISSAKHAQIDGVPYIEHVMPLPGNLCFYVQSNMGYRMKDTMTNGSVINLQAFLRSKGYLKVEPTGYFGPLTVKAVKSFQKEHGIPQTGFAGPLTREKMKSLTCTNVSPVEEVTQIEISTKTDKTEYEVGEAITLNITAYNNSDKPVTLQFSNGCQTHYMIDGTYNSVAAMLCIQALTSETVKAKDSFTWTTIHESSAYELSKGTHTIVGTIVGYGSATTTVTVE